jgi:serine/threonine-protein kinase
MSRHDPNTFVGRVLDNTYRIVRPLASGGMGAVYEAVHARLGAKRYAVKVLHPVFASNPEVFKRFRREAEITSQLGHEHIVEVQDFQVAPDGTAYMVMEYLDGEDLATRIDTRAPLPLADVVRIIEQAASALTAAHAAGVVHRDLKPQNIFLVKRSGRDDFVKILDFGISKVQDSSSLVTRDQAVMGTPFYMSPEQAMGNVREVDGRTDVFALATIIFEMLTGEMAFASDTIPGALYKVVHEQVRPVHELRPELPPTVAQVLGRALAKDRANRTPSAEQLARELAVAANLRPATLPPVASLMLPAPDPIAHRPPTTMSSSLGELAVTPLRPTRGRKLAAVLIAGAMTIGAVAFTVGRSRAESSAAVAPPVAATAPLVPAGAPAPPRVEPAPVAVEAPPRPALVTVQFDVEPSSARAIVHVDGRPLEGHVLSSVRGDAPIRVTVAAKGYEAWSGDVVPDDDRTVLVRLQAQQTSRRHRRRTAAADVERRPAVPAAEPPAPPAYTPPPQPVYVPPQRPVYVPQPQPVYAPHATAPAPPPAPAKKKKKSGTIFD